MQLADILLTFGVYPRWFVRCGGLKLPTVGKSGGR